MRKRNFINCFFYYFAIITLPLLMVFLFFLFFVIQEKKQEIQSNAKRSAQAAKDNYSLVMDTAATQYDILARNPRLSISLRNFLSHEKANYLDVVLTNSILSNFTSLTNNAPYIASVYYYLDDYDSILTSDTGGIVKLSRFSDLSWKDSYDSSDKDQWLERRQMHQYSYAEPIPVLTYFKKLNMFRGVVMVNIYEEQLKQLITTSSQLDSFFILDQNGNFLLEAGKTKHFTHEDRGLLANKLSSVSLSPFEGWLPFSNGSCYTRMIPADCDTYIAACISYSNYYRDFYPLLLQLLMVLAAMVLYPYGLPLPSHEKIFSKSTTL